MNPLLVPGAMVRHPTQPDWGVGQVQSVIGERVTVNFEDRGKVLINAAVVELEVVERERQRIARQRDSQARADWRPDARANRPAAAPAAKAKAQAESPDGAGTAARWLV